MSLPVVAQPTFTTELKRFGKIKYRNFVNSEQKALLTAIELGDTSSVFNTMLNIVETCTDKKLSAKELSAAELEFIFLKIYIRSVQNKAEGQYTCHNMVPYKNVPDVDTSSIFSKPKDDAEITDVENEVVNEVVEDNYEPEMVECGHQFKVVIPIGDATISEEKEREKAIKLNDEVTLYLRVPSAVEKNELMEFSNREDANEKEDNIDTRVIYAYFDYVMSHVDDVKSTRETTSVEEFIPWFDTLSPLVVDEIIAFIENEPVLTYDFNIICPKCKSRDVIKFRGLESFFV